MLTHLVLFRFPDQATSEEAIAKLRRLPEEVPDVRSCHVGADVSGDARAYDVGLVMTFADADAFARYNAHPAHVPVADWIHDHMTDSAAVDFRT